MENILSKTGATFIDWAFKTECCGAGFSISKTDVVANLSAKIVEDAFDRGAESIVVACPKAKNKKKILFYSQTEYNVWYEKNDAKQYEIKYKKGLGALVDDEYDDIINNPRMTLISKDTMSENSLDIWFGKNSDPRKTELLK